MSVSKMTSGKTRELLFLSIYFNISSLFQLSSPSMTAVITSSFAAFLIILCSLSYLSWVLMAQTWHQFWLLYNSRTISFKFVMKRLYANGFPVKHTQLGLTHVYPAFINFASVIYLTHCLVCVLLNQLDTTRGLAPPSSKITREKFSAAFLYTSFPVSVDPVKKTQANFSGRKSQLCSS